MSLGCFLITAIIICNVNNNDKIFSRTLILFMTCIPKSIKAMKADYLRPYLARPSGIISMLLLEALKTSKLGSLPILAGIPSKSSWFPFRYSFFKDDILCRDDCNKDTRRDEKCQAAICSYLHNNSDITI